METVVAPNGHPRESTLFEKICPSPGLLVIIADQGRHQGTIVDVEIGRAPVVLSCNLNQRIQGTLNRGKQEKIEVARSPGDSLLSYLPHAKGRLRMGPGRRVAGVSVHFSIQYFIDLFKEDASSLKKLGVPLSDRFNRRVVYQAGRLSSESLFAVRQILDCPYTGSVRRIFMEAKAMELAALKLAEIFHTPPAPARAQALNHKDLEAVREAHHILLTGIDDPPGLAALSRRVGINRNKLNRGFKQLYGKTAFQVLRNARLSRAWTLLQQSELSLADIAAAVGYSNQSNFSTAFSRQFGRSPKSVRWKSAVPGTP